MAKRGGDVKKAPPGFYTAREARERLNILPSAFQTMVTKGEIERVIPPLRREGYYKIEDIDRLANQQDLFFLQNLSNRGTQGPLLLICFVKAYSRHQLSS